MRSLECTPDDPCDECLDWYYQEEPCTYQNPCEECLRELEELEYRRQQEEEYDI